MKRFVWFLYIACLPLLAYQDRFEIEIKSHPAPRAGKPHIHWCTMCGADNCYKILKETIEIIEPYFDEIHIIDNGSTDDTPRLVELSPKVTYKRIDNWDGNWAYCYAESIREVRKGEWFMFHDSDERPSPQLLKNLRRVTARGEREKVNVFLVGSCHHGFDDEGRVRAHLDASFVKWNFLRREDMKIAAFGSHTGFHLLQAKPKRLGHYNNSYFYNHYKSTAAGRRSVFTQGFMYPTVFEGLKPYAEKIIQLREKLGITHITGLFQMLYLKNIPDEMRELIASWEQVPGGEAREIWELVIRDNCDVPIYSMCDNSCCYYK